MSRTFKRPMFRKGGTTGGGIMDNVVERGQYAKSNADDLGVDTGKISLQDEIDAVMAAGGKSRLDDPLTQFLLQVGPNIAGTTSGGGLIPNLLLASKEPVSDLIKSRQAERKTRQAIALDLFKDIDKDKATQFIRKAKEIAEETGKDYQTVLNELYQTEIYRKGKSEEEKAADALSSSINDIVEVTKYRGDQTLTTGQAKRIYNNEQRLKNSNPEIYNKFDMLPGGDKYILRSADEYTGDLNSEAGAILADNALLGTYPENTYFYDVQTGNFIYRQGKRVFKVDLDITED